MCIGLGIIFQWYYALVRGLCAIWAGRYAPREDELLLNELLDRAETDLAFRQQLVSRPLGVAAAAGLSRRRLRDLLGMPTATDAELGNALVAQALSPRAD